MGPPDLMSLEVLTRHLADRYRIERELGAGGMAIVYLAHDLKHDRRVAVKVLRPELEETTSAERFFREIAFAARLVHPNILPLHDSGSAEGHLFYVTPYLEGESLRAWLAREQRLPLDVAVGLATEVADALDYAHRQGVVHRDIKPENILISDGHAIVADFGIATAVGGDARLTATGVAIGSRGYMSPEQATGSGIDGRSDIFSLACVFVECVTGTPITHANVKVPDRIGPVIRRALSPEPTDRYARASEFKRALLDAAGTSSRRARTWTIALSAAALVILSAIAVIMQRRGSVQSPVEYVPLTSFADAATSPALSPDGRMLAFIRGHSTFFGPGQIYVKPLTGGEAVQLTTDSSNKMDPRFTPDGSRVTYTAFGGHSLDTWIVPVLGGEPSRLLLANAEGLTWFTAADGKPRVVFSEITGHDVQMAISTSTESRDAHRTIYLPPETGMAHRSRVSPDGRLVLVSGEMTYYSWLPCHVTSFDGQQPPRVVGPVRAQCTNAAWSPDGKWMYFTANTGQGFHIWRQHTSGGAAEQLTRGTTEEEGIDIAPDGRSFVTSIGTRQSTLWYHDGSGDRQLTSEGYALTPSISPDGKRVYYLLRANAVSSFVSGALWMADLQTGRRQPLLQDFLIQQYAISPDGEQVLFIAADDSVSSPLWLASLDGRAAPRRLVAREVLSANFGAHADVVFAAKDGALNYIFRLDTRSGVTTKVAPTGNLISVSPDGRVAIGWRPPNAAIAQPLDGGEAMVVCDDCVEAVSFESGPWPAAVSWSADGRFLYMAAGASMYAVPLEAGRALPAIPKGGFKTEQQVSSIAGARRVSGNLAFPGADPGSFAYTKVTTQRNIYRVAVP